MKNANRITGYIIAAMIIALAILTLIKGAKSAAETDRQLDVIDRKIAKYEADLASYRQVKAEIEILKSDDRLSKNDVKTVFSTISDEKMAIEASCGQFETEGEDESTDIANGISDRFSDRPGDPSDIADTDSVSDIQVGEVREELHTDFASTSQVTPEEFEVLGIIDWNGWRYTYYSEQVLPGDGLDIPGRWSDGQFVRDCNGYLCVASNEHEHGSIVSTPFGDAVVYDSIGDGVTGIIDIYVSW